MRCVVTGKQTDFKWKDVPLVKSAYMAAYGLREKNPHLTMRKAIHAVRDYYKVEMRRVEERIKKNDTFASCLDQG